MQLVLTEAFSILRAILLSAFISVSMVSPIVAEESIKDSPSPFAEPDKTSNAIFKFEEKDETTLLRLKGTGENREETGGKRGIFGLELFWGQLLFPQGDASLGYYFVSGKIESDNRQRFNSTFGFFPPSIGGELKVSYKALNAQLTSSLPLSKDYDLAFNREFKESALEQGLAVSYRKRIDSPVKEFGARYLFTHLEGESVDLGLTTIDSETTWRQVKASAGFADVDNHVLSFEVAAGSDHLDFPMLHGVRLDLGAGYQDATNEKPSSLHIASPASINLQRYR